MLQHIVNSWKKNRGNLLVSLGSATGLIMCLVWYFQLLPEVKLIPRSITGMLVSKAPQEQNPLVVVLRVPAQAIPSSDAQDWERRGVIELHVPEGELDADLSPLFFRSIPLDTAGPIAIVFSNVPPGTYAALAFIDLNGNERLDFEGANPAEPFLLFSDPARESPSRNLEEAAVQVGVGQTALIEFDFMQ